MAAKRLQRGFLMLPVIIGVIVVAVGGLATYTLKQSAKNEIGESPRPLPSIVEASSSANPVASTEMPTTQSTPKSAPTQSSKPSPTQVVKESACDTSMDTCFNTSNATINLVEGALEYKDNWVNDEIKIIGKGATGFKLDYSGDKELSVITLGDNFPDGGNKALYIMVQKNVVKKGTYKGVVTLRAYATNNVHRLNLTVHYVDWNPSAISSKPSSYAITCKNKQYTDVNGHVTHGLECDNYKEGNHVDFYYHGKHKIEIRESHGNNSMFLKPFFDPYKKTTQVEFNDTVRIGSDIEGFKTINEPYPTAEYKGTIALVDVATQKEIYTIPYTLKITN